MVLAKFFKMENKFDIVDIENNQEFELDRNEKTILFF